MDNIDIYSSHEPECLICSHPLCEDQPYAMINNNNEKGKYHIECLERWLETSNNGLLTQDKIMSYNIYHNNNLIEQKNIISNNTDIIIENLSRNEEENHISNNSSKFECDFSTNLSKFICCFSITIILLLILMLIKRL